MHRLRLSYDYKTERPKIFTEEGQRVFLAIRDNANRLCENAGCATLDKIMRNVGGDTWLQMACFDRLIELEEFIEIPNTISHWGQHRIIAKYMGR